jgi:hypothetical protein
MTRSRLDRMAAGPANDWTIDMLRHYAESTGSGAPHHAEAARTGRCPIRRNMISSQSHSGPIKPLYIRRLVRFVRAVMEARDGKA